MTGRPRKPEGAPRKPRPIARLVGALPGVFPLPGLIGPESRVDMPDREDVKVEPEARAVDLQVLSDGKSVGRSDPAWVKVDGLIWPAPPPEPTGPGLLPDGQPASLLTYSRPRVIQER